MKEHISIHLLIYYLQTSNAYMHIDTTYINFAIYNSFRCLVSIPNVRF